MTDKQTQKQLLTEIMNADAKDGLYDYVDYKGRKILAVDLLVQALPQIDFSDPYYEEVLRKVKRVERNQIEQAFDEGTFSEMEKKDAEEYYNEIYGK